MRTPHIWAHGLNLSCLDKFPVTALPGFDLVLLDAAGDILDVLSTIQAGFAITRKPDDKIFAVVWAGIRNEKWTDAKDSRCERNRVLAGRGH